MTELHGWICHAREYEFKGWRFEISGGTFMTCAAVCAGFIGVLAMMRGDK